MKQEKIRYKYPSNRNLVYGKKGMAATSHPLAAEAGLSIMRDGGNAIDAAVAMAAALTVLEPTSNGIGGDAFAIFSKDNRTKT
jgi:gamma-glutamyltranspeptidase/glutathione hydrolase